MLWFKEQLNRERLWKCWLIKPWAALENLPGMGQYSTQEQNTCLMNLFWTISKSSISDYPEETCSYIWSRLLAIDYSRDNSSEKSAHMAEIPKTLFISGQFSSFAIIGFQPLSIRCITAFIIKYYSQDKDGSSNCFIFVCQNALVIWHCYATCAANKTDSFQEMLHHFLRNHDGRVPMRKFMLNEEDGFLKKSSEIKQYVVRWRIPQKMFPNTMVINDICILS